MNAFWDLKIEASSEAEARIGISAFEETTGLVAGRPSVEPYWKMPECYESRFETGGFSDSPDLAIEELKSVCAKIGGDWYDVYEPPLYPGGGLDWSRIIDSRTSKVFVERLFWAHCQFISPETQRAEQDDAVQPATAVDSKAEGNEKPKLESEGRSQ
jgi:hypothetical protein